MLEGEIHRTILAKCRTFPAKMGQFTPATSPEMVGWAPGVGEAPRQEIGGIGALRNGDHCGDLRIALWTADG